MKKIFCDDCKEEKKETEVTNSQNESISDGLGETLVVRVEVINFSNDKNVPELCSLCLWKTIKRALDPEEIKKRKEEDIPF